MNCRFCGKSFTKEVNKDGVCPNSTQENKRHLQAANDYSDIAPAASRRPSACYSGTLTEQPTTCKFCGREFVRTENTDGACGASSLENGRHAKKEASGDEVEIEPVRTYSSTERRVSYSIPEGTSAVCKFCNQEFTRQTNVDGACPQSTQDNRRHMQISPDYSNVNVNTVRRQSTTKIQDGPTSNCRFCDTLFSKASNTDGCCPNSTLDNKRHAKADGPIESVEIVQIESSGPPPTANIPNDTSSKCKYCGQNFIRANNRDGVCSSSPQDNKRHVQEGEDYSSLQSVRRPSQARLLPDGPPSKCKYCDVEFIRSSNVDGVCPKSQLENKRHAKVDTI